MSYELTAERLRELLHYDQATGVFTRTKAVSGPYGRAGMVCGSPDRCGHLRITLEGVRHAAHRLAWLYVYGKWPAQQIDHINRIKTDNRIENLRDVSGSVNQQNQVSANRHGELGVRGVTRSKKRFAAMIAIDGKSRRIGSYKTVEEAEAAYLAKKRQLHPHFIL